MGSSGSGILPSAANLMSATAVWSGSRRAMDFDSNNAGGTGGSGGGGGTGDMPHDVRARLANVLAKEFSRKVRTSGMCTCLWPVVVALSCARISSLCRCLWAVHVPLVCARASGLYKCLLASTHAPHMYMCLQLVHMRIHPTCAYASSNCTCLQLVMQIFNLCMYVSPMHMHIPHVHVFPAFAGVFSLCMYISHMCMNVLRVNMSQLLYTSPACACTSSTRAHMSPAYTCGSSVCLRLQPVRVRCMDCRCTYRCTRMVRHGYCACQNSPISHHRKLSNLSWTWQRG